MKILVIGGAGYIGSHTCVELLNAGFDLIVYDNFSNSTCESLKRVEQITEKKVTFIEGDIRDEKALSVALKGCDAVIHFAGLKAVGESVEKPLEYYDTNVYGTLCLLRTMKNHRLKSLFLVHLLPFMVIQNFYHLQKSILYVQQILMVKQN